MGCWDQTLSFYLPDGTPHLKARKLHFYPCSLSFFSDGQYIAIGGSDKRATLCTKEAVRLCTIAEKEDWVWSVKAQPYPVTVGADKFQSGRASATVAVGCFKGSIGVLSLKFGLVSSRFADRYAYRSNMTDVVVSHLPTEKMVRIKCRDYVKAVAVYTNRLAVLLPDRINVWELTNTATPAPIKISTGGEELGAAAALAAAARGGAVAGFGKAVDMHYRIRKEKLFVSSPVDQLLVLARHVALVHGNKVSLCAFDCGDTRRKEREWILSSEVTVAQVNGGLAGREGLLVGLASGAVLKIFVDNPFPITLVEARPAATAGCAVVDLSSSCMRGRLAVVDQSETLKVYQLLPGRARKPKPAATPTAALAAQPPGVGRRRRAEAEPIKGADGDGDGSDGRASASGVVLTEAHVTAVAFNDEVEDSLCFSGHGTLFIKTGDFPANEQRQDGGVIAYSGNKVYCLGGERLVVPEEDEDEAPAASAAEDGKEEGKSSESRTTETEEAREAKKRALEKKKKQQKQATPAVKEGGLLASASLSVVVVPQSLTLQRYIEAGDFEQAYATACLGVTMAEWRSLALAAARGMALEVATKATVRTKDGAFGQLVASIGARRAQGRLLAAHEAGHRGAPLEFAEGVVGPKDAVFLAEILAFEGSFTDAAKAFAKAGLGDRAVGLFADLRRWDDAMLFAAQSPSSVDPKELLRRQAEWSEETGDWARAAAMLVKAGDTHTAVKRLGDHKPPDWARLVAGIASDLPSHEGSRATLLLAAKYLGDAREDAKAKAVLAKAGAVRELMGLLMSRQQWPEAVALAEDPANAGKFDASMFVPYAEWLALHDRFDAALAAYRRAGRPDQSFKMMEQLTFNAVVEGRFKDAAFYYLLLSKEVLKPTTATAPMAAAQSPVEVAPDADPKGEGRGKRGGRRSPKGEGGAQGGARATSTAAANTAATEAAPWRGPSPSDVARHKEFLWRAKVYFAYQRIEDLFQPFAPSNPDANFNVAIYLINALGAVSGQLPHGVSLRRILTTLARAGKELGAYKLARYALDKLHALVVPPDELEALDMDMLTIQATPVRDKPELLPVCFLSGATCPLLNPLGSGDAAASSCGHPFVRSMASFEVLPLVEFVPAEGISDDEAVELLRTAGDAKKPHVGSRGFGAGSAYGRDNDDGDVGDGDRFQAAVNKALAAFEEARSHDQRSGRAKRPPYAPVVCDAECLLSLRREEVFVVRPRLEVALGLGGPDAPSGPEGVALMGNENGRVTLLAMNGEVGRGVQYCRFYRNMLADGSCPVALSQSGGVFFMEEDLELALLKESKCPFSRQPADELIASSYGTI